MHGESEMAHLMTLCDSIWRHKHHILERRRWEIKEVVYLFNQYESYLLNGNNFSLFCQNENSSVGQIPTPPPMKYKFLLHVQVLSFF